MRTRRLLFFTIDYPRGIGELWKYDDICAFSSYFDEIVVVPTEDRYPLTFNRSHPPNVRFEVPILSSPMSAIRFVSFPSAQQLVELARQVISMDRRRISSCLRSIFFQMRFLKECKRRGLLDNSTHEISLFFFWARGAAEILAALPKGITKHVVVGMHGFDLYEELYSSHYIPFRTAIFSRSDVLAPCSEHGASYLRTKYPEFSSRIRVKRLGVEDFGQSPHYGAGPLRIVSCAFANPLKRLRRIVTVLSKTRTEFIWTHIGDGPEMNAVKELASQLFTSPGQQTVFPGKLLASEVRSYLCNHAFDLFLSLSETEGVPVSVMEALSAGIPVLATDAGGTRELVEEKWLLPVEFVDEDVARRIDAFAVLSSAERSSARREARARAESRARSPRVNQNFAREVYGMLPIIRPKRQGEEG